MNSEGESSGYTTSEVSGEELSSLTAEEASEDIQSSGEEEKRTCRWKLTNGRWCDAEFSSAKLLSQHLDQHHDFSRLVCYWKDCSRKGKLFDARYKLSIHLRCHTGERPYQCEILGCNRSFSRVENMKLHVRTHTGEKPYPCSYSGCTKRFNNTSDRAKHMKTHFEEKPYRCKHPGCTKRYTDPSSMRKHYRSYHSNKRSPSVRFGGLQRNRYISNSSVETSTVSSPSPSVNPEAPSSHNSSTLVGTILQSPLLPAYLQQVAVPSSGVLSPHIPIPVFLPNRLISALPIPLFGAVPPLGPASVLHLVSNPCQLNTSLFSQTDPICPMSPNIDS